MDWHDSAEAGEVDLHALEGAEHSLPCWNNRCCLRLLCRNRGACSDLVAASWTGMALSSAEGTEAYVAPIYHRQRSLPLEHDKGIIQKCKVA